MKKNILWGILNSIFLIVFNVLFFVLGGTEHNLSVWMSYGFIHFAYFMLLLTPKITRESKKTSVLGLSIYSISTAYFLTQFLTGIIFILVAPEGYKTALSVQLCIAGLYGIILVSFMLANEYTVDAEEKRQSQIAFVKDASAKLKNLLESISDKETKKKVERVYDAIYSSPVKSHLDLTQKENHILQTINELVNAVEKENNEEIVSIAGSLLLLVNERNGLLRSFN